MDAADTSETEEFEAVIGLEVHVQLRTARKMFCRCPSVFGGKPNSRVCETCLGYPGALPVANRDAVEQAVRLARALGATVHRRSSFARKSYFYPDQPKGYQITQHEHPLATDGRLPLPARGAGSRPSSHVSSHVPIVRLHLEEDAGKLVHGEDATGVDFDRCGVPLVEIVTAPCLGSPEAAEEALRELHRAILFTGTSEANLEEGSLRCDANVSLRRRGASRLGTRCEVKNLNSFRHVARALAFEIERQGALLEHGGRVRSETRSFDPRTGATRPSRGKEGAPDYRYLPDPDLPPLVVSSETVRRLEESLPELPWDRRGRFVAELGLAGEDAAILVSSPDVAQYFEDALEAARASRPGISPRTVGHWVRNEALRTWPAVPSPRSLADLIGLVESDELSSTAAKEVYEHLPSPDRSAGVSPGPKDSLRPKDIARRLDLLQIDDEETLRSWIDEILDEHPEQVAEYRAGKEALLGFFVGGVMRASGGAADPQRVRRLLVDMLQP